MASMVIFHKIDLAENKKDTSHLEHLALESEKKVALKIEDAIRKHHKHSDGSTVMLSIVQHSEIESILNDDEREFIKSHSEIEIPKYQGKSVDEFSSKGVYISETKPSHGPVFVCTCGAGFSGSIHGNEMKIYKIDDYQYTDEDRLYSHKPEPISDSYNQAIKYK